MAARQVWSVMRIGSVAQHSTRDPWPTALLFLPSSKGCQGASSESPRLQGHVFGRDTARHWRCMHPVMLMLNCGRCGWPMLRTKEEVSDLYTIECGACQSSVPPPRWLDGRRGDSEEASLNFVVSGHPRVPPGPSRSSRQERSGAPSVPIGEHASPRIAAGLDAVISQRRTGSRRRARRA